MTCSAYGQCSQGANCVGRTTRCTVGQISPEQSHHAAMLMDAARFTAALHASHPIPEARTMKTPAPAPTPTPAPEPTPSEAGNVWFVDSELSPLDEAEGPPPDMRLTTSELVTALAFLLIMTGIWVAGLSTAGGYIWARWLSGFVAHATGWLVLP